MPAARSGLSARGFHGGDMPSLDGDGGSIGITCSLSRASVTVLSDVPAVESVVRAGAGACSSGKNAAGACGTGSDGPMYVNKLSDAPAS